ncbi:tetratricopeptide repeat-containing sensor histidine kinase [Winogradskyella immobilis]|uniref:histidine kinase n=1 Tax=Winogradskyella immobilis TaxID=2816852 RepID=A0ABS8EP65_9FLAO|nr:tetratricopeptide repeat-containing sensor histidine kinase [Winogradskyella immobilis]MCC1484657.1 tetratricopeptide repeat-containing sensor histidine kinase [Winogradskyella immobilis]MCG0016749.1 tetratricopeptide repeat-containing sensor histidine kinase [Winogradskyella immobilis]
MKQLITYAACLLSLLTFAQNAKIDSLTVRLAYQNQDSTKIETSLLLINEFYLIKDYEKALLFIDQTTELSKTLNNNRGLAESNYLKALIYSEKDENANAINNFNAAKTYFQQIRDTLGIAKVNNNLGLIDIKRGNYEKGLQNSLSAISIFEKRGLNTELSKAYNNLAEAYFNTSNFDKALEYNRKALIVREEIEDKQGIKQSLKNIGILYALKNEHRRAIDNFERVLVLLDSEDKDLRGEITPILGAEYLEVSQLDKAGRYIAEGLRFNRRQKNDLGVLISLNAAGDLNIRRKKVKLALTQLNEAYNIANKLNHKTHLLKNLKLHVKLDSSRGFYQNAFFWQNKYYDLKTEIDKETVAKQLAINNKPEANTSSSKTSIIIPETAEPKPSKSNTLLIYGLIAGLIFTIALLTFSYLKGSKDGKSVKELSSSNTKLLAQNQQLEEVNQVKDKLFSIVSHDLKDSISSIKAFLDLLKDDGITKEEFNQLIPELSENANNASSLLFNLLNWSKSQMQNLEPKPELFNIQEVFHIKMSLVEKKVEDKGILLIDESKRDFVYADRSMLEIVIQNLITNAVKFTGKGDVITVSNQDYNGKVLISVEDTGIGISEENIKKLFNAKKNFTTIGTENEKGTGLGLTICKDLVELNKGRIWVESTPNIGSKFFIELPKAALTNV